MKRGARPSSNPRQSIYFFSSASDGWFLATAAAALLSGRRIKKFLVNRQGRPAGRAAFCSLPRWKLSGFAVNKIALRPTLPGKVNKRRPLHRRPASQRRIVCWPAAGGGCFVIIFRARGELHIDRMPPPPRPPKRKVSSSCGTRHYAATQLATRDTIWPAAKLALKQGQRPAIVFLSSSLMICGRAGVVQLWPSSSSHLVAARNFFVRFFFMQRKKKKRLLTERDLNCNVRAGRPAGRPGGLLYIYLTAVHLYINPPWIAASLPLFPAAQYTNMCGGRVCKHCPSLSPPSSSSFSLLLLPPQLQTPRPDHFPPLLLLPRAPRDGRTDGRTDSPLYLS